MERRFERNPLRELPDGTTTRVFPFHVSLEGLESKVLCREEADYDAFVKVICLCARRKNVILVIYTVVSNHAHSIVLACNQAGADAFVDEIKKMYSMYFRRKYQDAAVLRRNDAKTIFLDSDRYVRNAIAYVIRNALDNGAANAHEYKWTGFRAAFCGGNVAGGNKTRLVSSLSKRERRQIMHTGEKLDDVRWLVDEAGEMEPVSICDWHYIESAFINEQSFFLRLIGNVNTAEMSNKLVCAPRVMRTDGELLLTVNEISQRWFYADVNKLPIEKKSRLLAYVYHSFRTTPSQLARIFELRLDIVSQLLGRKK